MALEDNVTTQGRLSEEEETQLSIVVDLAKNLIDDGGYEVIEQAMSSKDPGQVIGQFLFQMVAQMGEQLPFEPSPNIFFAKGGWVEQISDYLQEEYDIPKKDMDRAEIYIAQSAQSMAQARVQPAPEQSMPAEQSAPVLPEGV